MTAEVLPETKSRSGISGWVWILIAGLFEVGFTYALKMAQDNRTYMALFLVCTVLSFECLSKGIETVPLSIGYAVWTGIGSVGAFIVGIAVFGDSAGALRIALVAALIAALISLKLVTTKPAKPDPEPNAGP